MELATIKEKINGHYVEYHFTANISELDTTVDVFIDGEYYDECSSLHSAKKQVTEYLEGLTHNDATGNY